MDIQEIRKKYPQYHDLSDSQLADALHYKFYPDMPAEEFNKKINFNQKSETDLRQRTEKTTLGTPSQLLGFGFDVLTAGIGGGAGSKLAKPVAEHLMTKAIAPTARNMSVREAEQLTKTALENGLNVTKGGVQKLRGMIRDLGGKVENIISSSKEKITHGEILQDLKSPEARKEFRNLRMEYRGRHIPIQAAQKAKQKISQELSDYSYMDIQLGGKSRIVAGKQELQDVLRKHIARLEPSVKELNQKMHELFNLRPHLERRVVKNMQKLTGGTAPLSIGARAAKPLGATVGAGIGAAAGEIGQEALTPGP